MTRRFVGGVVLFLAMFVTACSKGSSNPAAPSVPLFDNSGSASLVKLLSTPNPTWTGTTTATDGISGSVTVTFGDSGTVSWTGPTGTYTGTFSGVTNPGNGAHVTVTIQGAGAASACSYSIAGDVASGVFTGTYDVQGSSCIDKSGHGTVHLVQGAAITPVCTYTVSPLSFSAAANGAVNGNDYSTVTVTPSDASCTWTATSNSTDMLEKLTVGTGNPTGNDSSVSSTGSGSFTFKISVNNSDARTGTISVAGQTVTVSQDAKKSNK